MRKKRPRKIDDPAIKHNVPTHSSHKTVIHKGQEAMSREKKKIKEMRKGHEESAAATATKLLEKKKNNNHQPTVNTLLACSSETGSTGKTAGKWQKEEEIPEYPTHTKKKNCNCTSQKTQNSKTNGKTHLVLGNAISRERTGNRRAQSERREGRKKWMMAIQGNWFYTCCVVSSGPSVHPSSHTPRSQRFSFAVCLYYPAVSLPSLPGLKDLQIKHVK